MLAMEFIRNNPDKVKAAVRDKHANVDVDALLALDAQRRGLVQQADMLRAEQNAASKVIAEKKKHGESLDETFRALREVSDRVKALEAELGELERKMDGLLIWIPNCPSDATPAGEDSTGNVIRRTWGERRKFDFEPKPHWDLAKGLGIIDFERATKVAGTGFALFIGLGARLERALVNFMLDLHTREHGYTEVWPPKLVNRASMIGTGQLPKMEEDMYRCDADDLFLIPTAEVPVTNMHREEILEGERLPLCYTAYTPCFRREAGSYGKDTRGLIRVHEFDKVELVKFVRPGTSYDELEKLVGNAETVLQRLGIEYRVAELCRGDLSFAAAKCYDLEIWAPGVQRWLEVSSCSNFEDFQARRANIRFRDKGHGKTQFVHTLNGSGVALARLVLTLLELYQQADGTIAVPEALRPYMGGIERIGSKA
jgi:seryl-tRNA synthetase